MIYITYTYQTKANSSFVVGLVTKTETLDWKLDDGPPAFKVFNGSGEFAIVSVDADGPELTFLYEHFEGIPKVHGKAEGEHVTWRGEFARFIFDNL